MRLQSAVLLIILVTTVFGEDPPRPTECLSNKDCPSDELCAEFRCTNPCLLNLCDNPVNCKVSNHIPVCSCDPAEKITPPVAAGSAYPIIPSKTKVKKFRFYKDEKVDWREALLNCSAQGMTLATIENKKEQDTVGKKLRQYKDHANSFWLGGSDLLKGGEFVWLSTGKPLTYTNYLDGQPDNWEKRDESDNCLSTGGSMWQYKWWDYGCSYEMGFICQYYE